MRPVLSAILVPLTAGCSITNPILDPSGRSAPTEACHDFAAPSENQCVILARRDSEGRFAAVDGGLLRAGETLVAMRSAARQCQGDYSRLIVSGTAGSGGEMRADVADAFARGMVGRTFQLRAGTGPRHWVLSGISTPVHNPASAEIRVIAGEVRLSRICFKSYRRRPPAV